MSPAPDAFHAALADARRRITPPPDDDRDGDDRDDQIGGELADRETMPGPEAA